MASPKSLKRGFKDTGLGESYLDKQTPQQTYEQSSTVVGSEMAPDPGVDVASSADSSRLTSPAPSHASSSAVRDVNAQIPQGNTTPSTGTSKKKTKLTFAEKEVRRMEKETKDREKAEEKIRKEQEKEIRDRQKAEEKAKKEEEKRAKDLEKEARRLVQEEKTRIKEEEKRKKDEEKAKKEEEKNKKAKSQLRLNAFFAPPAIPDEDSQDSPTREGQTPTGSRRSSVSSVHGMGVASRERSTSASPKKALMTEYEKIFPSFFVKSHTQLASWNRFSKDAEGHEDGITKLDGILSQHGLQAFTALPSASQLGVELKLPNAHFRRRQRRRRPQLSVKAIVDQIHGIVRNPIDLTEATPKIAAKNPIDRLKTVSMKFLKFAEDVRPPYIGTFTKPLEDRSMAKLSRNPFTRALPSTDYDYDSEAEWEEPEEGEDLDSEGEEEAEDDDAEDMEGFLDDADTDEVKKRRPIIDGLEPSCTGLCWEDSQSNIHRAILSGQKLDLSPFRLDILLDNPAIPIDPYSTSYWQTSSAVKEASPSRMDPPRIPLNAINRLNLQLPNLFQPNTTNSKAADPSTATLAKVSKQVQAKRYIAPELLEEFKAAVQGSELTKLGLVEVLKKKFPKQSKGVIQDTLTLIAERVGLKESEKRWIVKGGT